MPVVFITLIVVYALVGTIGEFHWKVARYISILMKERGRMQSFNEAINSQCTNRKTIQLHTENESLFEGSAYMIYASKDF